MLRRVASSRDSRDAVPRTPVPFSWNKMFNQNIWVQINIYFIYLMLNKYKLATKRSFMLFKPLVLSATPRGSGAPACEEM